jgi:hypothetical protein
MLHPLRIKQRDLKNPTYRISSELGQKKNLKGSSTSRWKMLRVIRPEAGECFSVNGPEAGEDRYLLLNGVL